MMLRRPSGLSLAPRLICCVWVGLATLLGLASAGAQVTNSVAISPPLPDAGFAVLRVFGSLVLVIALFLIGVWCFRNWQRFSAPHGPGPKLKIAEVRPLGHRYALYVVAYEQQRFLVGSSPAGLSLLTSLPDAEGAEPAAPPLPNFLQNLQNAFARKP